MTRHILSKKKFYIAGPLFSIYERQFLEELVEKVSEELRLDSHKDFFLPHRDAGDVGVAGKTRNTVFYKDLNHLESADLVIALLDGCDVDSGTAVEIGYAYAKGKKIFGLLTDKRRWDRHNYRVVGINNMVWGVLQEGERICRTIDSLIENIRRSIS
jgi:nucleoside 2-deoxyribosyltransferase